MPQDLAAESEGLPETVDSPPEWGPKRGADEGFPLPKDHPRAAEGRVTAREMQEGETLDERLDEETETVPGRMPRQSGRLVGPAPELGELDKTADEVAEETEESRGGFTAEEAAMRIERER